MTLLCDIAFKYGTDKCPQIQHFYTTYYYDLLKDKRNKIKKVLEIGIGSPGCMKKFCKDYKTGASLYMWRDFFPKAQIYGADIDPQTMFKAERIKTFICNELNEDDLRGMIAEIGSDIDLFIDDGTHYNHEQVFLCNTVMPLLKDDVIYIIEDICFPERLVRKLSNFDCEIINPPKKGVYRDYLVRVKKYDKAI